MSSSPRLQGSRHSRSRSASNVSFRSVGSLPYRNVVQPTSDTGRRSPRRRLSNSPAHPHSIRSRTPSPSRPAPKKRFGMNIPTNQPRFIGKFDFEEKYPQDPINEEMGSNARVWRAFLDECEVFDADMVTEARDGLDLHLVFAGLFSAVLTTFVAQTSQALSTNFPSISTSLLVEMVALQRAQINATPIDDIPPGDTTAGPSHFDIWVNTLWFTSLALSLGTALLAVLVKQWLYQYMSMISGTARDRSLIRHYRFEGLQRWHVLVIIGTLPIILHIALGLFLAGLVIFLIPLNVPLASIVGFITLVIYAVYIISNILPLIHTHCPYRTPFSDILNVLIRSMRTLPSVVPVRIYKLFPSVAKDTRTPSTKVLRTLREAERIAATGDGTAENVGCNALLWLYQMTSNPPTKRVVLESLGCLSDASSGKIKESIAATDLIPPLNEITQESWDAENGIYLSIIPGQEERVERLLRGPRRYPLPWNHWKLNPNTFELPFQMVASLLTAHAHDIVVDLGSQTWDRDRFLVHLIRHHLDTGPICLPSVLWDRLISSTYTFGVPKLAGIEDDMFLLSLCKLALINFEATTPKIVPFAGPVIVTHESVPLFEFVVDILVSRLGNVYPPDPFDSETLTALFTIHDYALAHLPSSTTAHNHESDQAIKILDSLWSKVQGARFKGISENDAHAIHQRAESVILQNLASLNSWCDSQEESLDCYTNVLMAYYGHMCYSHAPRPEFFERLISDLHSSLRAGPLPFAILASDTLEGIFNRHSSTPIYWTLFCASPFLTTRTPVRVSQSRYILYPVVAVFVSRFTGGAGDVAPEAALQCMNNLSADPQCLFTVCRVLALGDRRCAYPDERAGWEEDLKQLFLHLAHVDPTHAVWTQRAHYMSMDPRDWPYLRLVDEELDDETKIAEVKEGMKAGLAILDEFFASFQQDSGPIAQTGTHPPPRIFNHSERIWRFVSNIGRGFRSSPVSSHVVDMELGLRPSGRVPDVSDHSRHIDDAPPLSQPSISLSVSHPLPSSSSYPSNISRTLASDAV